MERLVDRARASMNLLLALALALVIADVGGIGVDVIDVADRIRGSLFDLEFSASEVKSALAEREEVRGESPDKTLQHEIEWLERASRHLKRLLAAEGEEHWPYFSTEKLLSSQFEITLGGLIDHTSHEVPQSLIGTADLAKKAAANLEEARAELNTAVILSGNVPQSSVAAVGRAAESVVTLPAVSTRIPLRKITLLGACIAAVVLAYLASILMAMQQAIDNGDHEGLDWVFFHPKRLGAWLGFSWLLVFPLALLQLELRASWELLVNFEAVAWARAVTLVVLAAGSVAVGGLAIHTGDLLRSLREVDGGRDSRRDSGSRKGALVSGVSAHGPPAPRDS